MSSWLALPRSHLLRLSPSVISPHHWQSVPRKITSMGRKRKAPEPEASPEAAQQADESIPGSSQAEKAGPSASQAEPSFNKSLHVNPKRYRELKAGEIKKGPVIYWYSDISLHMQLIRLTDLQASSLLSDTVLRFHCFVNQLPAGLHICSVSVCSCGWLQDVKRSACKGQLGAAVCMRGG